MINGGFRDPALARRQLAALDGVMIGREAYENPWSLRAFETALFGAHGLESRASVLESMAAYAERQLALGVPLKAISRHVLGLYNGLPGARRYRRHLSERSADDRARGAGRGGAADGRYRREPAGGVTGPGLRKA